MLLSDLHIGGDFNDTAFLKYREWILSDPYTYCVIIGDVIEMATKNSVGDSYNSLPPNQQRRLAVKYLKPLAENKKILGYIDGNHEARANRETDEYSGEIICELMGIPSLYDPDSMMLFITVGHNKAENKKTRNIYTIYMLHGHAGGQTIGGKANALERLAKTAVSDIYVQAHTHQGIAFPEQIIMPDVNKRKCNYRKRLFVNAGAFMNYARYAKQHGFPPSLVGTPTLELSGVRRDFHARV